MPALVPLRRATGHQLAAGIYELLHLSTYHTLVALCPDGQIVGYTACALLAGGAAEDQGTFVLPAWRRQGVGRALRMVQVRDLAALGWSWLFCAVETEAGLAWAATHLTLLDHLDQPTGPLWYLGDRLDRVYDALEAAGVPCPHPLSPHTKGALRAKADRALVRLRAQASMAVWRKEYQHRVGH